MDIHQRAAQTRSANVSALLCKGQNICYTRPIQLCINFKCCHLSSHRNELAVVFTTYCRRLTSLQTTVVLSGILKLSHGAGAGTAGLEGRLKRMK